MSQKIPVISLWRPWANWVMLGWKPVESRKHNRLNSLVGQRIGIHAALKWDDNWERDAGPYLTPEQVEATRGFLNIGGVILGTVFCEKGGPLTEADAPLALIECASIQRQGLFLRDPKIIEGIPAKGKQGIWYHDELTQEKTA